MSTEKKTPSPPTKVGPPRGSEPKKSEDDLSWVDARMDRVMASWPARPYLLRIRGETDPFRLTEEQERQWIAGTHFAPGEGHFQYTTFFPPDPRDSLLEAVPLPSYPGWPDPAIESQETKPGPKPTATAKPKKKITLEAYKARRAAKLAVSQNSGDGTTPLEAVPMSASTSSQSIMSDNTMAKQSDSLDGMKFEAVSMSASSSSNSLMSANTVTKQPMAEADSQVGKKIEAVPMSASTSSNNMISNSSIIKKPMHEAGSKDGKKIEAVPMSAAKDAKAVVNKVARTDTPNIDQSINKIKTVKTPATQSAKDAKTVSNTVAKKGTDARKNANDVIEKVVKPAQQSVAKGSIAKQKPSPGEQKLEGAGPEVKLGRQLSPTIPSLLQKKVEQHRGNYPAEQRTSSKATGSGQGNPRSKIPVVKEQLTSSKAPIPGNANSSNVKDVSKSKDEAKDTKRATNMAVKGVSKSKDEAKDIKRATSVAGKDVSKSKVEAKDAKRTVSVAEKGVSKSKDEAKDARRTASSAGKGVSNSKDEAEDAKKTAGKAPRKGPAMVHGDSERGGSKSAQESRSSQQASPNPGQHQAPVQPKKKSPITFFGCLSEMNERQRLVSLGYGAHNQANVQEMLKEPVPVKKPESTGVATAKGKQSVKADQASQRKPNTSQAKGQETAKSAKALDEKKRKVESGILNDKDAKKKVTAATAGVPKTQAKDPKAGDKRGRDADDEGKRADRGVKRQKAPEDVKNSKEVKETREVKSGVKRPRLGDDERPAEPAPKKQKVPEQGEVKKDPKTGEKRARAAVEDERLSERAAKKQKQPGTPTGSSAFKSPTPSIAGGQEFVKAKRADFVKYNELGRTIKRQAQGILNPQESVEGGAGGSSEGAALGIQSVCCYIFAFQADDSIRPPTKREVNNWRSLIPLWRFVEYACRPFRPLHGICLQLGAIIREAIMGLDPTDATNTTYWRRLWLDGTAKVTIDDLQHTFPNTWARRVKNPLDAVATTTATTTGAGAGAGAGFYLPLASCVTTPLQAVHAVNAMMNEWASTHLTGVDWDQNRLGFS